MTDSEKFWGGDKGPPPTFRNVWLYWDDFLADEILGTPIAKKKDMNYIENIEPKDIIEPKDKPKKLSRTKKLYEDFKALSPIEKENFVNMIRNFVVHGHL